MNRLTIEKLSGILDGYIMPVGQLFPLCSESLVYPVSRLVCDNVSEDDLIDALSLIGYQPFISKDIPWNRKYDLPAKFKIRFTRDPQTIGLFSLYDISLCKSDMLKCIIYNAVENEEKRLRDFCQYINVQQNMCRMDVSDENVTDYLRWMILHTPSPKSTLAAVVLYHFNRAESDILTQDQLQYIRENPNLIMKPVK